MLIITPNRRLAAFSLRQINQQNVQQGKSSWETAEIYSLDAWLLQLWALCLDHIPDQYQAILSQTQQQLLLEQIIQNSELGSELLRINATAKNVLQAWDFMCGWQVSMQRLSAYIDVSADTAVLHAWLNDYLAWLAAHDYIDFNLMLEKLIEILPALQDKLPTEICLRGFGDLSPQIEKFCTSLRSLGITLHSDQLIHPGATAVRAAFVDADSELQAAANWAAQQLAQNTDQIIGIVVPELEKNRRRVASIFETNISIEYLNISAPLALSDYTLIDTALLLLQNFKPVLDFADLSILLRSPFLFGGQTQMHSRAQIDRQLREDLEAKLTWSKLREIFQRDLPNLDLIKGQHTVLYWLQVFQTVLNAWGWPGLDHVNSQEADLLSCWRDLLEEYSNLAVVAKDHTYAQALQILQRLAADTPFLPAETGLTKVHVLGILEADGIFFDQLWVTGMSRDTWPMEINPNPFIPLELQRQFDLPKSSAERELKIAQRLTANLQMGGKENVIFSYPVVLDDFASAATNLIIHLPVIEINALTSQRANINQVLEFYRDDQAPAITDIHIKGGTSVLRLQAQCPFKANAEIRLGAKKLNEPILFLNPAQRGSLVHDVLEQFWLACKDQKTLIDWYPETAQQILCEIIDNILAQLRTKLPYTLNATYIDLEKTRVLNLIMAWLEYELKREPFAVKELEHKKSIKIGPLQISARVDRIDQLVDGGLAIIDYKTGIASVSDWFTDPIIEPQLPLYAINETEQVDELYFASLREDDIRFKGVTTDNDLTTETLRNWREGLRKTATEFAEGNVSVKPFSQQICELCNLQALCRVYDC